MLGRQTFLGLALVLASMSIPLSIGTAAAHCPDGAEGTIVAGVTTCPYNEHLEVAVDQLNAASNGERTYVLVKDLSFHPEVVEIADGGTIVFVWGDVDRGEQHDPMSSGVGEDADCETAWEDPVACRPQNPGACFTLSDAGEFLDEPGDTYPVTLRTDDEGRVEVSEGQFSGEPIVGEPPFSPRFETCPEGTATAGPDGTITVPYHCGIHGGPHTTEQRMRAAALIGG